MKYALINSKLFDGKQMFEDLMVILIEENTIKAVLSMKEWRYFENANDYEIIDIKGKLLTPGLIDSHTHLIYAGSRACEFEARLEGESYESISAKGGGIMSTVNATRQASEDELYAYAQERLDCFISEGVTSIEIKSGYGLDVENELKILRVAKRLEKNNAIRIKTTLLGAHALPPEYKDNSDAYIDLVCSEMIPIASRLNLADAVDVFCEGIGFSVEQCKKVYQSAKQYNLPIKAHTEQLSNLSGSKVASEFGALSVDHIEYLDEDGIKALAKNKTIATILPGAFYILKETQKPPIDLLRQYQVPMAIASDANPGTSPIMSLRLMMNMACTFFSLTPTEALKGVTYNAAKALGIDKKTGLIATDMAADICVWDTETIAELSYSVGLPKLLLRIFNGQLDFISTNKKDIPNA